MLRTQIIAALTVALMGGTAIAAPANAPPSNLSDSARQAPDLDDNDDAGPPPGYNDRNAGPPPGYSDRNQPQARGDARPSQQAQADRDIFCRRDAAARTGYTTPGEAAHDEQVRGTVGGTLGGAALGAIIGAGAGNAGLGAAAGAGAGLIAGTAIGADNARHAARDVQADYAGAYYACMNTADGGPGYYPNGAPRRAAYGYDDGYDYPPPPGYYGSPYGYPYYPYYYGPSVSFGFGFGGGHYGGGRGFGGGGGFHGGGHHR